MSQPHFHYLNQTYVSRYPFNKILHPLLNLKSEILLLLNNYIDLTLILLSENKYNFFVRI